MGPLTSRRTGVGNFCFSLLKALLELENPPQIHGLAAGLRSPQLDELRDRAQCRHLPLPARAMYQVWNTLRAPSVETLVGPVDVFHATNYYMPPVKRAAKVLSVYDLAFLINPEWCSPKIVGPFTRRIRHFAQDADRILASSESTKRDVVELLGVPDEKIRVTYGAAEETLAQLPREEAAARVADRFGIAQPYLLFVGTIEPRKNVEALAMAFKRIARDSNHQLVVAGSVGWNADAALAALNDPAIAARVTRLGYVPSDDLAALYSAADALVLPSHYEGFGLPVVEAMTCGCPVITSNVSSLPEAGGDAAVYCDPGDTDSLAQAIQRVLSDPDLRSRMIASGYEQARRFSWRNCAEATYRAYGEVTS